MFSGQSPSRPSSSSSPYLSPHHLHVIATRKCHELLPVVLRIVKFHLTQGDRGLFRWDAGLIRDGCFFAGILGANVEGEFIDLDDDDQVRGRGSLLAEEAVALCLTALSEMRWGFSRSEERAETIRMIWENRKVGRNTTGRYGVGRNGYPDPAYKKTVPPIQAPPYTSHGYSTMSGRDRPLLPPLRSPRRSESAPSTAYSSNGQGGSGWPSYTPPGTATSVATSAGTGVSVSARGSPLFNGIAANPVHYKGDIHEPFYHVPSDMDQFSFHAPTGPAMNEGQVLGSGHYHHRDPPSSAHSLHSTSSSTYLDTGVFSGPTSSMVHQGGDPQGCPQFGDDCNGYYH